MYNEVRNRYGAMIFQSVFCFWRIQRVSILHERIMSLNTKSSRGGVKLAPKLFLKSHKATRAKLIRLDYCVTPNSDTVNFLGRDHLHKKPQKHFLQNIRRHYPLLRYHTVIKSDRRRWLCTYLTMYLQVRQRLEILGFSHFLANT